MKLIIAGGRDFKPNEYDYQKLDRIRGITEIVSGGCSGADKFGEHWAEVNKIPVKRFPADWNKFGKAAGPIRNAQMAEYANACVLFPGGKGTDSMFKEAQKQGLGIFDYRNK